MKPSPEPDFDASELANRIATLAMQVSRAKHDTLDPSVPFAELGLDSLATIELAAAIEDALGVDVPLDLLGDCVDARMLAARLRSRAHETHEEEATGELMRLDAVLPRDIQLPGVWTRVAKAPSLLEARTILLTGATGFLGGWLGAHLLERSRATLVCLVRRGVQDVGARVTSRLLACGADPHHVRSRVVTLQGDLSQPLAGLSPIRFHDLSISIDAVLHAGASINWVQTYRVLRSTNVAGTRELLRLAALHGRPFHFVSSVSVCYSAAAPARVDEDFNAISHADDVYLGYAQTKIVAEALVKEAARRGLPVSIYRPSLLSGHSRSGTFNADDLLSLLVSGCVRMGCAPDLDWTLDAVPVDVAAEQILQLSGITGTFHLAHPRPRHWRECVLWMRLYGYPLMLVSYHEWLRRLEHDLLEARARKERHPLEALRGLFFERPDGAGGLSIPELYEDSRLPRIERQRTAEALQSNTCPDLDASLLDRYFQAFIEADHLPPPAKSRTTGNRAARYGLKHDVSETTAHGPRPAAHGRRPCSPFDADFFTRALAGSGLRVLRATPRERGSAQSIIGELTAWRSARPTGIFKYTLELDGTAPAASGGSGRPQRTPRTDRTLDIVLKVKARDEDVISVGEALSALCDERIGATYWRWRHRLGAVGSALREIAIYLQPDPRLARHTPALLGSVIDDDEGLFALVLEDVRDGVLAGVADRPELWNDRSIDAAITGLATLHSIWYGQSARLAAQPWVGWIQSGASAAEMGDLWTALAEHARQSFSAWADPGIGAIHRRLVNRTAEWWRTLESQPWTLIHNDFNPRNICLRPAGAGLQLCAYDWELAMAGPPQRDLAELLCFVLAPSATDADIDRWVERHRAALEVAAGEAIDAMRWREGFASALYEVLVSRLSMYALIHRVRRQAFLPGVVRTWRRLYERFPFATE